ncbi:hydroxycarboxylic acid receptor 2-like [Chanos chanos]|uniref:Hydroxycarboxylic acid receptor 2-like n=1 Tax=Chanos chanos TaxID=29144 RepID=A0A6J2VWW2_CHACN|nr:hydroxycarboxylic acid receptor 2-like [Chanos chanos]
MDRLLNASSLYLNHSYTNQTLGPSHTEEECPSPALGVLFLVAIEIVTAVIGFFANLGVLWVLAHGQLESSTSDVFTGSLAALDGVYCLSLLLDVANTLSLDDDDVSRALLFLFGLSEIGGPLFLSCVCLDRYMAVSHPVAFMRLRDGRYRTLCTALVLTATLGYSLFTSAANFEHNDCIFIALFMAAFLIIIFCNLALLRALKQTGPSSQEVHPVKRRAFSAVLRIFILIIIAFLPAAVVFPYEHLLPEETFECYVYPVCYAFIASRAALQPLLFLSRLVKVPCLNPAS